MVSRERLFLMFPSCGGGNAPPMRRVPSPGLRARDVAGARAFLTTGARLNDVGAEPTHPPDHIVPQGQIDVDH
jgi:hypothetical protein